MLDLTASVQADKLLFSQTLNCDAGADSGMVLPCNDDHPVVEEFPVHKRIKFDWQPIDGDVHNTVTKGILKVNRSRDGVESYHDAGSDCCHSFS